MIFFFSGKEKKNDFIAKVIIFSLVIIFQYLIQLWVLPPPKFALNAS